MRHIEDDIQSAVCQHLDTRGVKGLVWFSVPNGGHRNKITAAILKRTGTKAGVSDLILFHAHKSYALELKAPKGRTSDSQNDFLTRAAAAGVHCAVAAGLDNALSQLKCWGLLK